jgi:hypothetical protein
MRALRLLAAASLLATVPACAGAGPYGHAKTYVPLGDEERAIAAAREYDPVMAVRRPEEWSQKPVSLFGVVVNRGAAGGVAYLQISVRKLEPRNLCENAQDEDSCRVTVSDTEFGVVHATVTLKGEDDVGEHSVGAGSLLRIVGQFGQDTDPNDGTPIIRTTYYRHWPRYAFVTKSASSQMRQ